MSLFQQQYHVNCVMGETKQEKDVPKIDDDGFVRREAHMWQSEKSVRHTASSGFRGHKLTAPFVNAYASVLVFLFHLTSVESLISIGLSVYLTICKVSVQPASVFGIF